MFRQLPDGRMLAWARHEHGSAMLIEPASGDLELLPAPHPLAEAPRGGRAQLVPAAQGPRRPL